MNNLRRIQLTPLPLHEDNRNVDLVEELPGRLLGEDARLVTFDVDLEHCSLEMHHRQKIVQKNRRYLFQSSATVPLKSRLTFSGIYDKCMALIGWIDAHIDCGADVGDGVVYEGDVGNDFSEVNGLGEPSHRAPVWLNSENIGHTSDGQSVESDICSYVDKLQSRITLQQTITS